MVDPDANTTLYTIGHSNRSLDEFIELLSQFNIRQLIDIRTIPDSRHQSIFNRTPFNLACSDEGIAYSWQGLEFGGRRRPKQNSPNVALNSRLRSYADHMSSILFQRSINRVCQLAQQSNTAFMCAERDPHQCHRNMIADYLVLRNWQVVHIINSNNSVTHQVNPLVRLQGQNPIYDQLSQKQINLFF